MKIKIPATSANLGPGFDTLGLALSLYNYVTITPSSCPCISIKGEGANRTKLKVNNMFVSIFNEIYQEIVGKKENFCFEFENNIPFSRGLGSSSAVIVGAIASAYALAQIKVSREIILNKALIYENHPDNIAPAVYGGFTSSVVANQSVKTLQKKIPDALKAIVVIPNKSMSTAHSRTLLPKSYPMADLVFNASRVGLMCAAFFSQEWEMLRYASQDRVHETQRMNQMKELFSIQKMALDEGALMSTLSGSGSSFLTLVYTKDAQRICKNLKKTFQNYRIEVFNFDNSGFEILNS